MLVVRRYAEKHAIMTYSGLCYQIKALLGRPLSCLGPERAEIWLILCPRSGLSSDRLRVSEPARVQNTEWSDAVWICSSHGRLQWELIVKGYS